MENQLFLSSEEKQDSLLFFNAIVFHFSSSFLSEVNIESLLPKDK